MFNIKRTQKYMVSGNPASKAWKANLVLNSLAAKTDGIVFGFHDRKPKHLQRLVFS